MKKSLAKEALRPINLKTIRFKFRKHFETILEF